MTEEPHCSVAPADPITFLDPDVQRCPFAAYEDVRTMGPVYRDPGNGFYIVTDYDLIRQIALNTKTFSSTTGQVGPLNLPYQDEIDAIYISEGFGTPAITLSVADPPEHGFYRSLVEKAFTPSRIRQMESYLVELADNLIDKFIGDGGCEFYEQFAMRLPMYVIADQVGVPKDNVEEFRRWSEASINLSGQNNTKEQNLELVRIHCELQHYILARAAEYADTPGDCILSDLVHADVDGRKLTTPELLSIVQQILTAGNETTVSMMSGVLLRIIETPGLEQILRADPRRLINFIEEVLRLDSPIQGLYRRVTHDTEIGGVPIPAESIIIIKWGAANRDPAKFDNAADFDIDRRNARQHLSFGAGPHFCIGSQLARAELTAALTRLLARMQNFRLSSEPDSVRQITHYWAFGLNRLLINFDAIQ